MANGIYDLIDRNLNSAMDEYSQKVYGPNGIAFNSPNKLQYDIDANAAAARVPSQVLEQIYPGITGQLYGTLSDLAMPAFALGSSPFYDMYQAGDRARAEYGIFNDSDPNVLGVTGDSEIPMGPSFNEYARAVAAENIPSSMMGRTLGAGQNLADRIESGNFPLSLNNVMDMGRSIKDNVGNFFFSPAGAAEINPTTNRNFNDSYNYNDVDAMTADEQAQLPFDRIAPQRNIFERARNYAMDTGASIKNIGTSLAGKAAGLPGVSFAMNALGKMDNFKNLNELDRNFILDQAGGNRPSKDDFGINRRSAFGNYGAYVDKLYEKDKDKVYDPVTQKFLYDRKVANDKIATKRAANLFIAQQEATAAKERAANVEFQRLAAANRARDESSGTGGPGETTSGTFGSSVNNSSTFSDYS